MDTITIELRSRLRSCNIFISTLRRTVASSSTFSSSSSSSSSSSKKTISLKLNESKITLKISNNKIHLPLNSVKIIPKSLSSLMVTDDWISLRVQTEPIESSYGSFKREIVGADEEDLNKKKNTNKNNNNNKGSIGRDVETGLKEKDLTIRCTRCKNRLTDVVRFRRVLPLPSDNSDPGEWFCCTHAATAKADEGFKLFSEPSESDCFYEGDYRVLNDKIFKKELNIAAKHDGEDDNKVKNKTSTTIRCNRCSFAIGERRNPERVNANGSGGGIKLWNCCVDYIFMDNDSCVDITASDPLKDFSSVIIDRTDIFTGNKILVEASEGDGSRHYLLVRVMDKNLELLTENEDDGKFLVIPSNDDKDPDYTVQLASHRVIKVLYKYSDTEKEIKSYSVDVDRCGVALPVMLAAVEHLSNTTKRFPPSYRVIDKYFVGYIDS